MIMADSANNRDHTPHCMESLHESMALLWIETAQSYTLKMP
jgi:hypothetical protein